MDQSCEHYNWNELEREVVRPGVERVGFGSDKVMCVMNWLSPGMDLFPHKHPFEQLVLIVQGVVLNLDLFAPPRKDYAHLVAYQAGRADAPAAEAAVHSLA